MTELFLVLIALVAVVSLVIAIVSTALKLRPARLEASGDSASKIWATLTTLVVFLLIVLAGLPVFLTLFSGQ